MKQTINHNNLLLLLFLLLPATLMGQQTKDTAYLKIYEEYLKLYDGKDSAAFMKSSDLLKEHFLKMEGIDDNRRMDAYYKLRMNEVLFELENGRAYSAIKKASTMRQDMDERGVKMYYIVYASLGTIYESRGNYRMANHYFMDALKNTEPTDTSSLMNVYSRLAFLKMARQPQEAWQWNERFGSLCSGMSLYHRIYLSNKATISLFLNDRKGFEDAYKAYHEQQMQIHDDYGETTMEIVRSAFNGDYEKALELVNAESTDFNELDRCDLRIHIYEMMGRRELALQETDRRRELRDSLNSDMLFNNINEINTEMGMAKMREQATKEREMWLIVTIVLLLIGIGLIVSRYLQRRRYQKRLLKQNHELEVALDRAQESDRMKTSFIEHVSHEIRTPLNVITGFAQVITNPDYELEDEERNMMLNDISRNTIEITNIVNELLELAQDESREHYEREDTVNVNLVCQEVMTHAEIQNNGRLTLTYKSLVDDDFTLHTNAVALKKILSQLLKNALKFTRQGTIELKVRERAANGGVEFTVTDTGIGIAEEHHDKVFERFYKVDSFKQGLGLGLTMSRKIAELLDGTLEIDKSYTKGARFVLILPTA